MTDLKPLNGQLPEPARNLAGELRVLFDGLGVSLTRYAVSVYVDKGAVSRYLSGERVPPWKFVHDLLVESTKGRGGTAPTPEVVNHLRKLQRAALAAGGSPAHAVQLLQDELAEAVQEVRRASERERLLESALQVAQHSIADLQVRERELESARDGERDARVAEIALYHQCLGPLHDERERLLVKIRDLQSDLATAHRRRIEADERCATLERQLDTAEQQAADAAAIQQARAEQSLRAEYEKMLETERARVSEILNEYGMKTTSTRSPDGAHSRGRHTNEAMPVVQSSPIQALFEHANAELNRLAPEQAATSLNQMSTELAAAALCQIDPRKAAGALNHMEVDEAYVLLNRMSPVQSASLLVFMDAGPAYAALNRMNKARVAAALSRMDSAQASAVLDQMPPERAAEALTQMGTDRSIAALEHMDRARATAVLLRMNSARFGYLLNRIQLELANEAMSRMSGRNMSSAFYHAGPERAAFIVSQMAPKRAIEALEALDPKLRKKTLDRMTPESLANVRQSVGPNPTDRYRFLAADG